MTFNIEGFWSAVLQQDADAIRGYFHSDAWVNWHNTNEHFNVEEYWGDDGAAPQWRQDKNIGTAIL